MVLQKQGKLVYNDLVYTKAFDQAVIDLQQERKEKHLGKIYSILEFIFLCVFGFTLGMGFTFGSLWYEDSGQKHLASLLDSQAVKGVATENIFPTPALQEEILTQENSELVLSCPVGFNFFQNDLFSLCYPQELNQIYEDEDSYLGKGLKITFASNEKELTAAYNLEKSWPTHICNLEEKVKIGSYEAKRLILQEEIKSGCGQIRGYVVYIKEVDNKPFYIKLSKFDNTVPDKKESLLIEKSLRLKE